MIYPESLRKGDIIGICSPSSGVPQRLHGRYENAKLNIEKLGYRSIETKSVKKVQKCVSTSAKERAQEFMSLYENNFVKAIIPPWGGEFLMEMLPYLDFDYIKKLPPKWIVGYSDITTLIFPLTLMCDIATIHGSNLMNMGFKEVHPMDSFVFNVMSNIETMQNSSDKCGGYSKDFDSYDLTQETKWTPLFDEEKLVFSGRMIGGCMDALCKILGTRFSPVDDFLEKYKQDGFIWTLESCEMASADIYRTLWQMRECGWFKYCNGILIGRADGYSDTKDFTLKDSLIESFKGMNIPVIYDADIGHLPPQIQIVNGAYGIVNYENNKATIKQTLK